MLQVTFLQFPHATHKPNIKLLFPCAITLLWTLTLGSLNLEWKNNPRPFLQGSYKQLLLNLHVLKCKNKRLVKTTATNMYQIKREARSCRETNLTSSCSQVQNARVHLPLFQKSITTIYLHIFLYVITKYTLLPKSRIFIDTIQCKRFLSCCLNVGFITKVPTDISVVSTWVQGEEQTEWEAPMIPSHQIIKMYDLTGALQTSCCFIRKYYLTHMHWSEVPSVCYKRPGIKWLHTIQHVLHDFSEFWFPQHRTACWL